MKSNEVITSTNSQSLDPNQIILEACRTRNFNILEEYIALDQININHGSTYPAESIQHPEYVFQVGHELVRDFTVNYDSLPFFHYLLLLSFEYDALKLCKLLLKSGVNPNSVIWYPTFSNILHAACREENKTGFAKLFIEHKGDVNKWNNTGSPLMGSLTLKSNEIFKLLIAAKAEVNGQQHRDGHTCLTHAVYFGEYEICKILIENKAEVNNKNRGGESPLSIACENQNHEIYKLLIDNGATVIPSTPSDCMLAFIEALVILYFEKLETPTPYYKLIDKAYSKQTPESQLALEFYTTNPLYQHFGIYLIKVLGDEEKVEKSIENIEDFLQLLENYLALEKTGHYYIRYKMQDILDTYDAEGNETLFIIKTLVNNEIFDLEHFNIFDYSAADF